MSGNVGSRAVCASEQTTATRLIKLSNRLKPDDERNLMLYTIAIILLIMWVLGLATSYTLGGLLHVLLVVAVIMILFNLISGRRAL